jgi:hypothetical protein
VVLEIAEIASDAPLLEVRLTALLATGLELLSFKVTVTVIVDIPLAATAVAEGTTVAFPITTDAGEIVNVKGIV